MKRQFALALLVFITFAIQINVSKAQTAKQFELVQISTDFGDIVIWLYDQTPIHKSNFLKLAKEGFYNGTTFHRIINNFMVQGGDPNSKGSDPSKIGGGGPGYTLKAEIMPSLTHTYGTVAAARMGDQMNPERRSSGSQFYIVDNKQGTPHLNGAYTVFGKVISGMNAVETISVQPKGQRDMPTKNIVMKEVKVLSLTKADLKTKYNFVVPQ
ncbi:MAG: peptidylprolyl isomerase [Bacteroidetes bacterium]|nr:peptidylprolyl isomerase [Bacteroidota bacterium]MBT3422739.1 peptidylprolyl isomerase [Bacteroidota bacterium]MBT3799582.1 peptidylprolyl isomerase [Bacteroidota bacterium]MBT3934210.1 peptidylprolyl isomerase [Bacteroidota bacterium]MBT4727901.1 peptidylprolyl isomerase [Bacteroidota bacterium]